jgi:hypothetical protein
MADIEYELVVDNATLRAELGRIRGMAHRAIVTAMRAQDEAGRSHDAWLDEALADFDDASPDN